MKTKKNTKKRGPTKGAIYKDTNPFEFGKILARQRRKKGLSQTELGKIMGVTKRVISRYERQLANPSMEIIKKVSRALNISPRVFIEPSVEDKTDNQEISRKLKKRLEMAKDLSPKSQKSLQDYIDVLVKAEGKIELLGEQGQQRS